MWRARAVLGAVVLAGAGCAARSDLGGIGTSSNEPPGATPTEAGGTTGPGGAHVSPIPKDFRTAWTHVGERFASVGHAGGRWYADVYADGSGAAYLPTGPGAHAPHGVAPVGARFVEEHFERGDAGAGPIFLMEKRPSGFDPAHGDWRYVAVGAGGDVAADGPVPSCAGCHGDAPGDHVFRAGGATEEPAH